jgi:hypothetical protein
LAAWPSLLRGEGESRFHYRPLKPGDPDPSLNAFENISIGFLLFLFGAVLSGIPAAALHLSEAAGGNLFVATQSTLFIGWVVVANRAALKKAAAWPLKWLRGQFMRLSEDPPRNTGEWRIR